MEQLLNTGIKQIIDEHPKVGEILESHDIGCVPCSLGTCLLKDIVDIHNLTPEVELEMMTAIAREVYPDRTIEIKLSDRKSNASADGPKYSPPMKLLVDEHTLIKRVIALIPTMGEKIDLEQEQDRTLVLEAVDFIRSFADKYHHAKEEDILFKYFDQSIDIIQVMLQDHVHGRNHVKAVVEAVEEKDQAKAAEHLLGYAELLTQHIKKEDEILYPWMDREMSDRQVGQMYAQFQTVDQEFDGIWSKYEALVIRLEQRFSK